MVLRLQRAVYDALCQGCWRAELFEERLLLFPLVVLGHRLQGADSLNDSILVARRELLVELGANGFADAGEDRGFIEGLYDLQKSHKTEIIIEGHLRQLFPLVTLCRPQVRQVDHHSRVTAVYYARHCHSFPHRRQQSFEDQRIPNDPRLLVIRRDQRLVVALRRLVDGGVQHPAPVPREQHEDRVPRLALLREALERLGHVGMCGVLVLLVVHQHRHLVRGLGEAVDVDQKVLDRADVVVACLELRVGHLAIVASYEEGTFLVDPLLEVGGNQSEGLVEVEFV
mmetsp:Transcript_1028/g.2258  ORF Transcript_1028/g.2258 Transcript_1028/m.2258 type:complete len:284 (+) Transcript_1028:420-1271(+)